MPDKRGTAVRRNIVRRLIAAAAIAATLASPSLAQPSSVSRGEALLGQHCAMCHAIGRSGISPHAQAPPFRTLGRRYPIESLEEALGEGLLSGHPDMPEFSFAPRDVGAIIRYLQSIQE
jgi:mono/diheme cytochrome c family protein